MIGGENTPSVRLLRSAIWAERGLTRFLLVAEFEVSDKKFAEACHMDKPPRILVSES
jgi:hypothetical protein